MKRQHQTTEFRFRSIPLIVAALLLAISLGPTSSVLAPSSSEQQNPLAGLESRGLFIQSDPAGAESGGGMLPDAFPVPGAACLVLSSTAPSNGPQEDRFPGPERATLSLAQNVNAHQDIGAPVATKAAVESSLARRFTLVGAKPSGTS